MKPSDIFSEKPLFEMIFPYLQAWNHQTFSTRQNLSSCKRETTIFNERTWVGMSFQQGTTVQYGNSRFVSMKPVNIFFNKGPPFDQFFNPFSDERPLLAVSFQHSWARNPLTLLWDVGTYQNRIFFLWDVWRILTTFPYPNQLPFEPKSIRIISTSFQTVACQSIIN